MSSLQDLGTAAQVGVLRALDQIAEQHYSWLQFTTEFGWRPLDLSGPDTFPGANELHEFIVQTASKQLYKVIGYSYDNVIVVCAIARKT